MKMDNLSDLTEKYVGRSLTPMRRERIGSTLAHPSLLYDVLIPDRAGAGEIASTLPE